MCLGVCFAEGDRKAYYETSQWTIKQNRETVAACKRENKELRQQLSQIHSERSGSGRPGETALNPHEIEINRLNDYIAELRKRYDDIRQLAVRKMGAAEKLIDDLKDLEKDGVKPSDEDSPTTRHIRMLENRLDKALVKYNEAQSIRRTYEQIVKRLREERIGFDNQLAAIERTLKAKEHDLEELVLMSHDANHAKEVAKAELAQVDEQLARERLRRERELAERRSSVRAKQEMLAKQEAREKQRRDIQLEAMGDLGEEQERALKGAAVATILQDAANDRAMEDEQRRVTSYEEAFKKIKEATGVSDVQEVISKFMSQGETSSNLHAMGKDVQTRIDALNEEKAALRTKVEEVKYAGGGGSGSRRVIDEHEQQLGDAQRACDGVRGKYERLARVVVDMKAGIEHLTDKLEAVKLDLPAIPMSDDTVVDVLAQAEQKLLRSLDVVAAAEEGEGEQGGGWALTGGAGAGGAPIEAAALPAHNVRVTEEVADDDEDDEPSDDEVGGDVPDRSFVKLLSKETESRAARKLRRKKSQMEGGSTSGARAGMA